MGTTAREFYGPGGADPTNDDGAYGTDVRKLVDAQPANNTIQTTIARFTNDPSGTVITFDPVTTRTTTGFVDDLGWAINFNTADGMQSDANAKRHILSGVWRFRGRWNPNSATVTFRLVFKVYRVAAAPGRARTLLFTHTGPDVTTALAENFDYTTASQAEIFLEDDESIQVTPSVEARDATGLLDLDVSFNLGAGALGEAHWQVTVPAPGVRTDFFVPDFRPGLNVVMIGRESDSPRKVKKPLLATLTGIASDTPRAIFKNITAVMTGVDTLARQITAHRTFSVTMTGIESLTKQAQRTISATLTGIASLARKITAFRTLAATMVGVDTLKRKITAFRVFSATMTGVDTLARRITAFRTLSARMVGVDSLTKKVILNPLIATMLGAASLVKQVQKTITATMLGVASLAKLAQKLLSATMTGVATLARKLTARRTLAPTMLGRAAGLLKIAFEKLPTGEGGTTIIKKILFIFDD